MLRSTLALTCAAVLAVSGCASSKTKPDPYEITLAPTAGHSVAGHLSAIAVPAGVRIRGRVTGLAAGSTHGMHIHQNGDCSAPDAITAGAHFNPTATEHGDPAGMIHHAGDMPNLVADAQGNANVDVTVHGVSIDAGTSDDILGRSVIVHADPDDFVTQPAGNSGDRVACGVILKYTKK